MKKKTVYCWEPVGETTWIVEPDKEKFVELLLEDLKNATEDDYVLEVRTKQMTESEIKDLPEFEGY